MVINPIVRVYIPIIRIPIKGGMTIPNIATFDHGTYVLVKLFSRPHTTKGPPKGSGLVSGNGTPKISGKYRLVKYYNLPRYVGLWVSPFFEVRVYHHPKGTTMYTHWKPCVCFLQVMECTFYHGIHHHLGKYVFFQPPSKQIKVNIYWWFRNQERQLFWKIWHFCYWSS